MSSLRYQSGFGNDFATEALEGALPQGQNSPQVCPFGLYAEQLSGTAFTVPRAHNRRSWLYRILPTAAEQKPFKPYAQSQWHNQFGDTALSPDALRWSAPEIPEAPTNFVDGVMTWAGNGSNRSQSGVAIHYYLANQSMTNQAFYNADAEMLFVAQQGSVRFVTELGLLEIEPHEIAVIPRGVRFRVELVNGPIRGYMLENFGALMRPPELGPIGSNGLANVRDFLSPVAWYEENTEAHTLVAKFDGRLWETPLNRSPFDVVAWHGNYAPYKYDLRLFNVIGSISYDHPDPSIFTVLTSPTATPGVANLDFVAFAPRILAMENTFRPPWFHRNIASEFMGLIHGDYDAKADGFVPGGASLHNCMTPHGPDKQSFDMATQQDTTQAQYLRDTMAFMFETPPSVLWPTAAALESAQLQDNYLSCWGGLERHFDANRR